MSSSSGVPQATKKLVIENALISEYANVTTQFDLANKLDRFPYILDAIAHFNYHLARHCSDDPFEQRVSLELFNLKRHARDWAPDEEVGNLLINNEASLLLNGEARYGLSITNRSKHDLFPYLFYFDPSDYSISVFFVPPLSTGTAPLHRQQGSDPTRVTIGFGTDGGDPLAFTLKPGEPSKTGFFKLFVFSEYIEMDWLGQKSAFEGLDRRKSRWVSTGVATWDAWVATVTTKPQSSDTGSGGS